MDSSTDGAAATTNGHGNSIATVGIASDATFPVVLDGTNNGASTTDSYLRQQNAQLRPHPERSDDPLNDNTNEPAGENLREKRARKLEEVHHFNKEQLEKPLTPTNAEAAAAAAGRGKAISSEEDARLQAEYRQMLNEEAKGSPLRDKKRTEGQAVEGGADEDEDRREVNPLVRQATVLARKSRNICYDKPLPFFRAYIAVVCILFIVLG
eukprot:GDKK01043177.1.p1 GENE.GDKK01043177.1~~GDKK01043177.1.p1  ORF type:complete len:210 (-),score=19.07 GDKK01043177.1:93-722(-)